jgi:hypothetical protein
MNLPMPGSRRIGVRLPEVDLDKLQNGQAGMERPIDRTG